MFGPCQQTKYLIFLDIDGVVNCADDFCPTAKNLSIPDPENPYRRLNKNKITLLNEIIEKTGAKCVLSSNWRMFGYKNVLAKHLIPAGFKGELIGETPPERRGYRPRGFEIAEWLKENNFEGTFIILDDNPDMVHLRGHLIHTDFYEGGLMEKHVKWAIAALNGNNPQLEGPQRPDHIWG